MENNVVGDDLWESEHTSLHEIYIPWKKERRLFQPDPQWIFRWHSDILQGRHFGRALHIVLQTAAAHLPCHTTWFEMWNSRLQQKPQLCALSLSLSPSWASSQRRVNTNRKMEPLPPQQKHHYWCFFIFKTATVKMQPEHKSRLYSNAGCNERFLQLLGGKF